jgi:hypothetical protein
MVGLIAVNSIVSHVWLSKHGHAMSLPPIVIVDGKPLRFQSIGAGRMWHNSTFLTLVVLCPV